MVIIGWRLFIYQGYLIPQFPLVHEQQRYQMVRFILEHEIMLPVIWFNFLNECVKTREKFVGEAKYKSSAGKCLRDGYKVLVYSVNIFERTKRNQEHFFTHFLVARIRCCTQHFCDEIVFYARVYESYKFVVKQFH